MKLMSALLRLAEQLTAVVAASHISLFYLQ